MVCNQINQNNGKKKGGGSFIFFGRVKMSASREMKTEIARDHYEVWKETSVEAAWNSINHDTSRTKPLAAVDGGVDGRDLPAIFNPLILKGPFPLNIHPSWGTP